MSHLHSSGLWRQLTPTPGTASGTKWKYWLLFDQVLSLKGTNRDQYRFKCKKWMRNTHQTMLSMVDQIKKDLKMYRWLHMSQTSSEYNFFQTLCGEYEAQCYYYFGCLRSLDDTRRSMRWTPCRRPRSEGGFTLIISRDGSAMRSFWVRCWSLWGVRWNMTWKRRCLFHRGMAVPFQYFVK